MFSKILIANRGEIAVRVIRACRDLGISAAAVYSEADRQALHVKLADEAYPIGPAPSAQSYLRADRIVETARHARAEAVHPGYGFLSENDGFAQACEDAGLVFIGPSVHSLKLMGDKLASRQAVRAAGVPVVPGSDGPVETEADAVHSAAAIGYPVMLKASAGGGGKGLRLAGSEQDLRSLFAVARGEAEASFADSTLYLEKYLEKARHIEVQVLGDLEGQLVHLGERECSIQRRHQKLVEESPSPAVSREFRRQLGEAALAVARAARYSNAGTVEFIVEEGSSGLQFYFLEMNTRLQVEHPVTELVTGVDLVCQQIRIAAGEKLPFKQEDVRLRGWAMECRVYAEDPHNAFYPSPGRITTYLEPSGPGIRNDSGLVLGSEVSVEYDPLISKLLSWGESRPQAIGRMRRALREYKIGGVRTTIPFFECLLSHPDFARGRLHTQFIEKERLVEKMDNGQLDLTAPLVAAALDFRAGAGRRRLRSSPLSSWQSWERYPNDSHSR